MITIKPIHPGKHLAEFLEDFGITQYRLAKDIYVPPRRINEIVHGNRAVSADTAIRLSRALGTSEKFWMGLQADYDLEEARKAAQSLGIGCFSDDSRLFPGVRFDNYGLCSRFCYQRHCIPFEIFRVVPSLSRFCCYFSPRYGILQP